jgi:tetratricopeptide (TPR) repeat protein
MNTSPLHKFLPVVLLMVVVACVYGQAARYEFIELDDPNYVSENRMVRSGLTPEGVRWAFTNQDVGLWIPLTWLSYMAEIDTFGIAPGRMHLVNMALHMANILLLFGFLAAISGRYWESFFVAALYGLHPIHVESVVWITERKDVLCAFFFLCSLLCYTEYAKRGAWVGYVLSVGSYILALMAKPMVVTMPLLLLLLDAWPLKRIGTGIHHSVEAPPDRTAAGRIILEKIPYVIGAISVCAITILTTAASGALRTLTDTPLSLRLANALVSYVIYIGKLLVPVSLSVLYPFPVSIPMAKTIGAAAFLVAVTGLVTIKRRQFPHLFMGWWWYLIALAPVIGIVTSGPQALADRFTYIPFWGLYIAIVWTVSNAARRVSPPKRFWVPLAGGILMLALSAISWSQVQLWKDSETLMVHALRNTRSNLFLHRNLAFAYQKKENHTAAIRHFEKVLAIDPQYHEIRVNLAAGYLKTGQIDKAAWHADRLIEDRGALDHAWNLTGLIEMAKGRLQEAKTAFNTALKTNPRHIGALTNLGKVFWRTGKKQSALAYFKMAVYLKPQKAEPYLLASAAYLETGHLTLAIRHLLSAIEYEPHNAPLHNRCGLLYIQQGNLRAAITHFYAAVEKNAAFAEAHNNLGAVLMQVGNREQARYHIESALKIQPDYALAIKNLEKLNSHERPSHRPAE